jgi:agmatinase
MLELARQLGIFTVAALLIPRILAHQSILKGKKNVDDPTWPDIYDEQWDLPFSGPVTFEHLPYTRCLMNTSAQFDIAILGMPFDNKVTFRTG